MKQRKRVIASEFAVTVLLACVAVFLAVTGAAAAATPANVTGLGNPPTWAEGKSVHFMAPPSSPFAGSTGSGSRRAAAVAAGGPESGAPPLIYYGGRIQPFPQLYLIFWGNEWNTGEDGIAERAAVERFYYGLQGSAWEGILAQYYGPLGHYVSVNGAPTVRANYTDTSVKAPQEVNNESVAREISATIKSQGWQAAAEDKNTQFILLISPGSTFQYGYGARREWCGLHQSYGVATETVLVTPGGGQCFFAHTGAPSFTFTASHEYAESATDPQPGHGWGSADYSTGFTEAGDMCHDTEPVVLPNGATVSQIWDNRQNRCSSADGGPYQQSQPAATTGGVSGIEEARATLNGVVNPEGAETHYYFEYGETTAYGNTSPWEGVAAGISDRPAQGAIANLRPGTVYHYRLVASNAGGTERGTDRTFLTASRASGNPVAIRVSQTEVDTYRRGADGNIYGDLSAGGGWKGPSKLPVNAGGAVGGVTVAQNGSGEAQIYWRGADGKLYGDISTTGRWEGPYLIPTNPGGAAGDPSLVRVSSTELDIYWRGANGLLYGDTSTGSGWKGPFAVPTNPSGAAGDPVTFQEGPGRIQLYWRGTNGLLYGDLSTGSGWQGPFAQPTNAAGAAGDPSVVRVSPTEIDLYWRGADGKLYGNVSSGAGWQGPYPVPGNVGGAAGDPVSIAAASGQVQLYWRGADGKLYGDVSAGGGWQGPYLEPTNPTGATGDPSLVRINPSEWDLYWLGADGTLYGDVSSGAGWQGPYPLP
jgi:hypothetical protein